jgi:hypothetical protein
MSQIVLYKEKTYLKIGEYSVGDERRAVLRQLDQSDTFSVLRCECVVISTNIMDKKKHSRANSPHAPESPLTLP